MSLQYLKNFKVLLLGLLLLGVAASFTIVSSLAQTDKTQATARCEGSCVAITREGMVPNELAVTAGSFVEFYSDDGQKHDIAVGQGSGEAHDSHGEVSAHTHEHTEAGSVSGVFGADEAWRVQFKEKGTYMLHDHLNPKNNILVVVY
jgi:plastocyanin